MTVYVITGKLGGGKSLTAVSLIGKYLNEGKRVATNLDIYPENFRDTKNRNISITRVPDKPALQNLIDLGEGYSGKYRGEDYNGILVLDELGTWFNTREWHDKTRRPIIEWFLHSRKLRWDLALIIQNIDMLDSQARIALAEHTVWMRRTDRFRIPLIGLLTKLLGHEIRLPKVHVAIVKYGDTMTHPTVDEWPIVGKSLHDLYDTEQKFHEYESGNYELLTPWHLVGRYGFQHVYTIKMDDGTTQNEYARPAKGLVYSWDEFYKRLVTKYDQLPKSEQFDTDRIKALTC